MKKFLISILILNCIFSCDKIENIITDYDIQIKTNFTPVDFIYFNNSYYIIGHTEDSISRRLDFAFIKYNTQEDSLFQNSFKFLNSENYYSEITQIEELPLAILNVNDRLFISGIVDHWDDLPLRPYIGCLDLDGNLLWDYQYRDRTTMSEKLHVIDGEVNFLTTDYPKNGETYVNTIVDVFNLQGKKETIYYPNNGNNLAIITSAQNDNNEIITMAYFNSEIYINTISTKNRINEFLKINHMLPGRLSDCCISGNNLILYSCSDVKNYFTTYNINNESIKTIIKDSVSSIYNFKCQNELIYVLNKKSNINFLSINDLNGFQTSEIYLSDFEGYSSLKMTFDSNNNISILGKRDDEIKIVRLDENGEKLEY